MEKAKRLAFKKFLDKYAVTKNYPPDSVILWEKYLVYGTALGVSTKALSQFSIAFPSNNELKKVLAYILLFQEQMISKI